MPKPPLSNEILQAALAGFQLEKQRVEASIAEVQALLKGAGPTVEVSSDSTEAPTKGRRKRSAAVRKRMAEAQKARWAKLKGDVAEPPAPEVPEAPEASEPPAAPKAKRKISEAGMKRIIAATKKRWRNARAAKSAAPAKKAAVKKVAAKAARKAAPAKKEAPAPPAGE
jgi:hypothetical protein